MPLTYVIDASRRIIIARASGVLTEDDLRYRRSSSVRTPEARAMMMRRLASMT